MVWLLKWCWLYNKNKSVPTRGPVSLLSLVRIYSKHHDPADGWWHSFQSSPWAVDTEVRPRREANFHRHRLGSSSSSHLLLLSDVSKSEGKKECVVKTKGLRHHQCVFLIAQPEKRRASFSTNYLLGKYNHITSAWAVALGKYIRVSFRKKLP